MQGQEKVRGRQLELREKLPNKKEGNEWQLKLQERKFEREKNVRM